MKRLATAFSAGAIAAVAISRHRARNHYDLSGRTVLITGGARGLGFALAREFGRRGARLFLVSRTAADLERARERLDPFAASVDVFVCDVRDSSAVQRTVERIVEQTGGIDVLVNNAGVIQMMPFEHAQDADFDESLQTHFWAPLHCIRASLPHMPSGSRIVNIASIGGRVAVPHLLPYCCGKFALVGLSEGLRAELARRGLVVTTVTPGLMRTGSHRNVVVRGHHHTEAAWFALLTATPLTSMDAERAARQIVDAAQRGDATVTPGWQAQLATVVQALAPAAMAMVMAFAAKALLPGPVRSPAGDRPRYSKDLGLAPLSSLFPTPAAERLNQTIAADEVSRTAEAGRAAAAGPAAR